MNAKQFFDIVVELRTTQKEYFKTRSPIALTKSKSLEKEIDDEIRRVQAIQSLSKQLDLFNTNK